ncbi:unnamed protein product [Citrullus colocynthis]|uniref:Transmembrane protein n=1 Tax=Citrullus colocynthis TaxID=252529 RepID=A0ABP0YHR2_9ROSI
MDQTWRFAKGGDEEAGFATESGMKEEEERDEKRNGNMKSCKTATWVVSMVVACLLGGLVFGWWEFQFHPTNRQLWMLAELTGVSSNGSFVSFSSSYSLLHSREMQVGTEIEGVMKGEGEQKKQKNRKLKVVWVCVVLVLVSVSGAFLMGWWAVRFHRTQKQQWMVPFGLVLMIAPIFVLISVFISSFCTSMDRTSSLVSSLDHDRPPEIR